MLQDRPRLRISYPRGLAWSYMAMAAARIREGIWHTGKDSQKEEPIIQRRVSDFMLEGGAIYFIYEERGDALDVVPLR